MKTGAFFLVILAVSSYLIGECVSAAEWPQYRGANQDGISTEDVNVDWGADGPKVVWKVPMNRGFSSFALLIVMGISLAYITTIILLPALIVLFDKKQGASAKGQEEGGL